MINKYRLKAPAFTGEEAVEQFIQEFQEVMEIAQWPPRVALLKPRVALLKLRMALRDKAKPYGTGPDIDGIFASLRARFGISAIDARAHLLQQRADMTPEVLQNLRTKPVWTGGLRELQHLQGNSPGVVAEVY